MTELQVVHTADLDPAALDAGRSLLYEVFDDMADSDWEHALGGMPPASTRRAVGSCGAAPPQSSRR